MYNIDVEKVQIAGIATQLLRVGFGEPATNAEMIKTIAGRIKDLINSKELRYGGLTVINGAISAPIMCTLTHEITHLFSAVGVFDPKVNGYVIAVSHSPDYKVGDLLIQQ